MAAKKGMKARAAARKQRDKWRLKRWFTIRAPRYPWNFQKIGETLGETEEQIIGRVYEMTQQEFNGDFTKMHVILRFRVNEIVGQDALTMFIGHAHQSDHTRRQIRRYRGKIDTVVDIITTDGYLLRIKTLMITERRIQTSVKSAVRVKAQEMIIAFGAKNTYAKLQQAILDGTLEADLLKVIKPIYPMRTCVIRKSQLLQSGVTSKRGPTLDDIHGDEARADAELKAKKAAALATVAAEEEGAVDEDASEEGSILAAAEAMESISEKTTDKKKAEEPKAEEPKSDKAAPDYSSMKVAELKDLLKEAGKPVSGKKADLIARLEE
jgi:small subunit ribosomal protein S3Ae